MKQNQNELSFKNWTQWIDFSLTDVVLIYKADKALGLKNKSFQFKNKKPLVSKLKGTESLSDYRISMWNT